MLIVVILDDRIMGDLICLIYANFSVFPTINMILLKKKVAFKK